MNIHARSISLPACLRQLCLAAALSGALLLVPLVARTAEVRVGASAPGASDSAGGGAQSDDVLSHERLEEQLRIAQEQLERAAQRVAELSMSLNDEAGEMAHLGPGSRTVLGINIGTLGPAAREDHGVRILSVSPGGPADAAGLKAGDVIVSFAGQSVTGDDGGLPQRRLLTAIRHAKPDQPVALEYRRGGKLSSVQIVPKTLMAGLPGMQDMGPPGPLDLRQSEIHALPRLRPLPMVIRDPSGFGTAELVDLSPRLGQYFGVDKGLLVVRAPRDERLKLQDGDVIIDIDGRVPTGVTHAFQILSSYHAGESLKLHIMRQQKRMELPVQIPEPPDEPPA
jgi:hypothetical protein